MPKKLPAIPPKNQLQFRKHLSVPSLLAQVRQEFDRLKEQRIKTLRYKLTDVLMSALAIFGLKYPSLSGVIKSAGNSPRHYAASAKFPQ